MSAPPQSFCSNCGTRVDSQLNLSNDTTISQFRNNNNINNTCAKKKITPIILGVVGVCVIVLYLLFNVFLNPQHYIEKGDYNTAYKVVSKSSKENILRENIVAVISADCIDSLKDSSSFELQDAWIVVNDTALVLLKVSANNSFGSKVVNYWHYSWEKDENKYKLYTTFSDFDEEKIYSWDDDSERMKKSLKNIVKIIDKDYVSGARGIRIDSDSINRINELSKNKILKDVTLIDVKPQKTE